MSDFPPISVVDCAALAAIIRKLRRNRANNSLLAYLVCEIADVLPVADRARWHDMCRVDGEGA
jgi:hypothetical protein